MLFLEINILSCSEKMLERIFFMDRKRRLVCYQLKGVDLSKRDALSDINLSPVQLINVALLDYMNNMGVVSLQKSR